MLSERVFYYQRRLKPIIGCFLNKVVKFEKQKKELIVYKLKFEKVVIQYDNSSHEINQGQIVIVK